MNYDNIPKPEEGESARENKMWVTLTEKRRVIGSFGQPRLQTEESVSSWKSVMSSHLIR